MDEALVAKAAAALVEALRAEAAKDPGWFYDRWLAEDGKIGIEIDNLDVKAVARAVLAAVATEGTP